MKRKILIITSSLTFALAIVLTITLNTNKHGLSDLALANVEALANGESGGDNYGPAEFHDCKGLGTGDWKACMCTNMVPCTESSCK